MIDGELYFDPLQRATYAVDSSLYQIDPLGVVAPRHEDDVRNTLRYALEHQIPVHPRGSGTGLAGESLGRGLILDFSRHFRRILSIDGNRATVQSGVILDRLNEALAPLKRRIAPDPSGSQTCTMGGLIASDSSGARSIRYGTTADHVTSMRVMFANGEIAVLESRPWPRDDLGRSEPEFLRGLERKVATLVNWHNDVLMLDNVKSRRNRAGYALKHVRGPDGGMNLGRLVVGSEGTLAIVLESTWRVVPQPPAQGVVLLPFSRLVEAAAAVPECMIEAPSACDLHDYRSLGLLREALPEFAGWEVGRAEAALLVLFEEENPRLVEEKLDAVTLRLLRRGVLVSEPITTLRREECERLLALRRRIMPFLLRNTRGAQPVPLIEDVAVPPESLPLFLHRLQTILRGRGLSWTLYAHAAAGQLHPRPFLDLSQETDRALIEDLATQVYEAVWEVHGTISGEHGCGLVRSQFLRRQHADLFPIFREVKAAFDPWNLLNPGKVVCDDPHQMTRDLRTYPPQKLESDHGPIDVMGSHPARPTSIPRPTVLNVLEEEPKILLDARERLGLLSSCNGCGECKTLDPFSRMCPSYRAHRSEASSPRGQVDILRMIAGGSLDPRLWGSEELRKHAELCLHCKLCALECPSGIDVSSLMIEAKVAAVANHGLSLADWVFARLEVWAKAGGRVPWLSNLLLGNPLSRWVLERTMGLSRHRRLPRATRRPFLNRASKRGLTVADPRRAGPRVVYLVDVFANHFDPEIAESTVDVLLHCGVNVYVPLGQRGSGMAALLAGDLDHARALARSNLRVLAPAVRDGYVVVCSEPTAALMLRQEYPRLTDDLDAELVARSTMDLGEYLQGLLARDGVPRPHMPLHARVGYHQPCHLRALEVGTPGMNLLQMIPEMDVEFIDRGCSGMAGIYGMRRNNFRTSLRAGRALLQRLRDDDIEIGATECGACRIQMEQGSTRRVYHPLKLLAMSYGLNPSLKPGFKERKARHVIVSETAKVGAYAHEGSTSAWASSTS